MNRESIQIRSSSLMCQLCDAAGEFPSEFLKYEDCRLAPSVQVCGTGYLPRTGHFQLRSRLLECFVNWPLMINGAPLPSPI